MYQNTAAMKSTVFQYPYNKVFRRTRGVLSRLGLRITSQDEGSGNITAESTFSLIHSPFRVDLTIEEMENHDTRVTVTGLSGKRQF
ncbi:MAG: hypothetical protein IT242_02815, partial [Bacteroidia bacterium]|nr:hypothetical protein [Bacteroidia bacterium]